MISGFFLESMNASDISMYGSAVGRGMSIVGFKGIDSGRNGGFTPALKGDQRFMRLLLYLVERANKWGMSGACSQRHPRMPTASLAWSWITIGVVCEDRWNP